MTLVDVCTALAILFTIAVVAAAVAVTVVALADLAVERVTGHELLPRDERNA
jgi:hypothetical protein